MGLGGAAATATGSPRRHVDVGVGTSCQGAGQRIALAAVDRQAVGPLHVDDACREPAAVHLREPAACVVVALLMAVHGRRRARQVPQVLGEPLAGRAVGPAEAAVVDLGSGHDVLDVGLPGRSDQRLVYGPSMPPRLRTLRPRVNAEYCPLCNCCAVWVLASRADERREVLAAGRRSPCAVPVRLAGPRLLKVSTVEAHGSHRSVVS